MKAYLIFLLVLGQVAFADSYHLTVNIHGNDDVELMGMDITAESPQEFIAIGDYSFRVYSAGSELFRARYDVQFLYHGHGEGPGGEPIDVQGASESRIVMVRLPFFAEADRIEIYNKEKRIYAIDLVPYLCNNDGACAGNENARNCPADCAAAAPQGGGDNTLLLIAGAMLVLAGAAGAYLLIKRRNEAREAQIISRRRL